MKEHNFTLHFKLADPHIDPYIYEDSLFKAGCDDVLLGVGIKGFLGLDFIRTADNVIDAIYSAIDNVKKVVPDARLYYISPDVVSIPEIALIMNCSRQNILKLRNSHVTTFPLPINSNGKTPLWHLAEVLKWYQSRGVTIDISLLKVAEFAMHFNLERQDRNIDSDSELKFKARALVS